MYQVIARKWRPQTFAEVTGQEHITRTLRNAIEHERVAYAYLFSGARGVGKTTTARLLAKALNCHRSDKPTATPCALTDPNACASCLEIADGRSIDVLEIDAASNTGVDNVRAAVLGNVAVRPARDRYKVFIIDEVHMLSGAAFNALLKTLEEPPPRVVFIMATTESHKVPDTILSRCQQFEFRTIATSRIAERLRIIADTEKIDVTDDALREIARAGEGSMRDAQSAFDQVISFGDGRLTVEDVEAALGIAGAEILSKTMAAIAAERPAEVLAVVDNLTVRGHDLRNFCRDLLVYLRNLLVAKVAGEGAAVLDATEGEQRELMRAGADFSESDLVRFFHALSETENGLRLSAHPRYQLEIGLIKLIEMRRLAPLAQVVARLEALERSLGNGGKLPAATSNPSGAPPPPPAANPGGLRIPSVGNASSAQSNAGAPRQTAPSSPPAAPAESPAPPREIPSLRPVPSLPPPGAVGGGGRQINGDDAQATPATQPLRLVEPEPTAEAPEIELGDEDDDHVLAAVTTSPGTIVEEIKEGLERKKRPLLVIALEGARQVSFAGDELLIKFPSAAKHLRESLTKPEAIKVLREVCREVVGRDVGVRILVNDGDETEDDIPLSAAEEARLEKQKLREMAEQHPTVQHFLRTFHGEIIDVRRLDADGT